MKVNNRRSFKHYVIFHVTLSLQLIHYLALSCLIVEHTSSVESKLKNFSPKRLETF